jgi:hypothetical protein
MLWVCVTRSYFFQYKNILDIANKKIEIMLTLSKVQEQDRYNLIEESLREKKSILLLFFEPVSNLPLNLCEGGGCKTLQKS